MKRVRGEKSMANSKITAHAVLENVLLTQGFITGTGLSRIPKKHPVT